MRNYILWMVVLVVLVFVLNAQEAECVYCGNLICFNSDDCYADCVCVGQWGKGNCVQGMP